jgi:hypothetical protein
MKLTAFFAALGSGAITIACAVASAATADPSPQDLPAAMTRYTGSEYDGVWSGQGKLEQGNCTDSASIKFTVKGGRIMTKGFTEGASFGNGRGSSKVFGVILQDKSIDLTLLAQTSRGRDSQARGELTGPNEMRIHDPGGCTYTYTLTKG